MLAALTIVFCLPVFIMTTKTHVWQFDIESDKTVVRGNRHLQIGPFSW
jgi:hypothetical protein